MLACAEAGLAWLERGEAGVRDFVTMAHERAVRDGCTGMFGRFHYFLNAEGNVPAFEPIRQIIVDRLSEIVPYGPEDPPLFGVRPARRYTYIPVSEIWRPRGGPMSKINPLLRSHGLEPAFPSEKLRCTFYPRANVDRIFPPH